MCLCRFLSNSSSNVFYINTHSTHNGDFTHLSTGSGELTVEDIAVYLAKVLHHDSPVGNDSNKIAGLLNLLHVQGRWGAAARLAYQRSCATPSEVLGYTQEQKADDVVHPWQTPPRLVLQSSKSSSSLGPPRLQFDQSSVMSTESVGKDRGQSTPGPEVWNMWEKAFGMVWMKHIDDVIVPHPHPTDPSYYR